MSQHSNDSNDSNIRPEILPFLSSEERPVKQQVFTKQNMIIV